MKKKPDLEFAERLLLSLVNEAVALETSAARVRIQIARLAAEFGIAMPEAEPA
ncbi:MULTISPECIES: hypothetical protein [Rhodopseudomonas]|uniref:hypothetical protein n=1 Tax=Rhodopseudomonas TaxID=1073 RepID=UPI000A5ED1E9|nr:MULTISPECIES: hypothetical protein [Rhodopseudomonas]MDF3810087.1 hypothetical protein [Rhodopseudomonas sp. BAL398]WOK18764.1 hypothetical protein RBJ75_04330 [Rhodopseudomonas sp. BAL398]